MPLFFFPLDPYSAISSGEGTSGIISSFRVPICPFSRSLILVNPSEDSQMRYSISKSPSCRNTLARAYRIQGTLTFFRQALREEKVLRAKPPRSSPLHLSLLCSSDIRDEYARMNVSIARSRFAASSKVSFRGEYAGFKAQTWLEVVHMV
jgi:hypothetical protein